MKIKEKIVRDSITAAKKEIEEIDAVIYANPLSEVIQLEFDTIAAVKKMPNEQAGGYLDKAIKKRKELLALAKKQIECTSEMITRKADLQIELGDLTNELFWIEQKKGTHGG